MGGVRDTFWRLRSMIGAIPVEREVDEELSFHLEMLTRRFGANGMRPDRARREAERRFGSVAPVREECRALGHEMEVEMRRSELRQELRQDLAFALRLLRTRPL